MMFTTVKNRVLVSHTLPVPDESINGSRHPADKPSYLIFLCIDALVSSSHQPVPRWSTNWMPDKYQHVNIDADVETM